MRTVIAQLRKDLKASADPKVKESSKRFFKEKIKVYGVTSALVGKIAQKHYRQLKGLDKDEVFALCEELFKSDYSEEAYIAAEWAYERRAEFVPADLKTLERWISKYVNTWAKCDTLCNHTVAAFMEMYPENIDRLKVWAKSDNRWVKRAGAVTLILPARNGKFLKDVVEIADILLHDEDDLVQKGYGWLLKEASRKHEKEVFNYIMEHKADMPRTALRYAIEKMPDALKKRAMAK